MSIVMPSAHSRPGRAAQVGQANQARPLCSSLLCSPSLPYLQSWKINPWDRTDMSLDRAYL